MLAGCLAIVGVLSAYALFFAAMMVLWVGAVFAVWPIVVLAPWVGALTVHAVFGRKYSFPFRRMFIGALLAGVVGYLILLGVVKPRLFRAPWRIWEVMDRAEGFFWMTLPLSWFLGAFAALRPRR
jgi:hypothetical protein